MSNDAVETLHVPRRSDGRVLVCRERTHTDAHRFSRHAIEQRQNLGRRAQQTMHVGQML